MKVYSSPIPAPEVDYRNYDRAKVQADEEAHQVALVAKLRELGYTGPNTGRILREPIADGYALYMFADGTRKSALIHLPYGDAWQSRDVQFLPKAEVLRRLGSQDRLNGKRSREKKSLSG